MQTDRKAHSFAALSAKAKLVPFEFELRTPRETDVAIEILYCGVCHSDIHQARDEWGGSMFPMVPGHEIIGKVTAVGSAVKRFKAGDTVGVGCMVDSCRVCSSCQSGLEQYCDTGFVPTYNGMERDGKTPTYGGYADGVVVDQHFVLKIPTGLNLAAAAPLLCAGITTYSPLRYWKVSPGQKVGIVGLGGLGHMGVKLADAMGAHVVVFTTSSSKFEDAKRLGADEVVLSKDSAQMSKHTGSIDFILDTVSAPHNVNSYLELLKRQGTLTLVGVPDKAPELEVFNLIMKRRQIAGSLIGGIPETQEMLDFCGQHGITSDVEIIPIQKINEAYERMVRSDVKYRFVIDMASLRV